MSEIVPVIPEERLPVTTEEKREIIEAVTSLKDQEGLIHAEAVLEAARIPTSPLHRFFEWDDAKAAEGFRGLQARLLIRWVRVSIGSNEPGSIPVSLVVDRGKNGGYRQLSDIAANEHLRGELLASFVREASNLIERHRACAKMVPELSPFLDEITTVLSRVPVLEKRSAA